MNARDRIEVPTTSWKLSRLNLYPGNGANEKRRVRVGEKLAGPNPAPRRAKAHGQGWSNQ
jgi:hypothetical protein